MILDEIKKDNVQSMKDRDSIAKNIYGILLNKILLMNIELKAKGIEITDADIIQIIQKTIKELIEESENYLKVNNKVESDNALRQKMLIEKYLPKMLSEDEVKSIISQMEDKSVPAVMRHFKENYAGQVDMAMVNKLARG